MLLSSCFGSVRVPRNFPMPFLNRISSEINLWTGCVALLGLLGAAASSLGEVPDNPASPNITKAQLLAMPMQFESNRGQVDSQVEFFSRGHGYTLWLTKTQAVLSLRAFKPAGETESHMPRTRHSRDARRNPRSGEGTQVDL